MKNGVTAMEITKQRAQSGLVSKTLAMREMMTLPSRLSYHTSPLLISSAQVNTNIWTLAIIIKVQTLGELRMRDSTN